MGNIKNHDKHTLVHETMHQDLEISTIKGEVEEKFQSSSHKQSSESSNHPTVGLHRLKKNAASRATREIQLKKNVHSHKTNCK